MKYTLFRGNAIGVLITETVIFSIFVCGSIFGLIMLLTLDCPPGVTIGISLLIALCVLIPGLLALSSNMLSYFTKLQVLDDGFLLTSPFKKKRTIQYNKISFWGAVAYAPRSSCLYLCTATQSEVLEYLHSHWDRCTKIFGAALVEQLRCSEKGMLQLAVGTYLHQYMFSTGKQVVILRYCTPQILKKMGSILKNKAIITGPWLIRTLPAWEGYDSL